jgi:hypothetical protein
MQSKRAMWGYLPLAGRGVAPMSGADDDAERSDEGVAPMSGADDDAEQESDVGVPPACGGEE